MYVNENIKNTERVFPMQGRLNYHRYDMNENPEGLPKKFVEDVKKEITPEFLAVYPEPDRFLAKYANYVNVDFDNVIATNGSDMAIRYLLETFGEIGKDIITVSPSFEMYWVNCKILGYNHKPILYENDLTIDVEKILAAIDEDTRIIVLLNPNNPIGNVYTEEEVMRIIEKANTFGAVVIIDEAYHYFYSHTFLPLVEKYDNVAILRTFSKLFSIAACRLGIIIASKKIIRYVRKAKLTFDANSIALLFAERLIEHPEIERELIQNEKKGKDYIIKSLLKNGYECRDCNGNFIFIEPHHNATMVAKELELKHKVLVKSYSHPLLKRYIRVSIGSQNSMRFFLEAFYDVDLREMI